MTEDDFQIEPGQERKAEPTATASDRAETLERVRRSIEDARFVLGKVAAFDAGGELSDHLIDYLIAGDELLDEFETASKILAASVENVKRRIVDRFIETETDSMSRKGKTVYLAREYWPGPKITDLLPEGVDPKDDRYADTVARVREAARLRLIQALKDSANHSGLVVESYNAQSLRGALTGKNAERDALDVPILPDELAGVVDLNPRTVVRVRKATR